MLFAFKTDPSKAIQFLIFNMVILGFVTLSHLFYFNFHKSHEYDLDDFSFFNDIHQNSNIAKKLMIIAFLLHAY